MNLLILNYPYLAKEFTSLGHKVITAGHYDSCMVKLTEFSFTEISRKVDIANLQCVIYADSLDEHFLYQGMENFPCPTIYVGIDSTINYFWQQHYARIFDLIFFDQPAEVGRMQQIRSGCYPLFLGFDSSVYRDYGLAKEFDITFAGRLNNQTRPKRNNLLQLLAKNGFKVNLIDGVTGSANPLELAGIYNCSRIVINENLFPGINLRIFEALGSNTLLFTEDSCPDLAALFDDGADLVTYNADNLLQKLAFYLANPQIARQIAKNGCLKAHRWHTDIARAEYLLARVMEFDRSVKNRPADDHFLAQAALSSFLKWPNSEAGRINQQIMQDFYSGTLNQNLTIDAKITRLKIAMIGNDLISAERIISEIIPDLGSSAETLQTLFWAAYQLKLNPIYQALFTTYLQTKYADKYADLPLNETNSADFYRIIWADYLYDCGRKINFGLTTPLPEIFCSAFDFYNKCAFNPSLAEISMNRMADILLEAHSYDFAEQIYRHLQQINPDKQSYREKADLYRQKSFGF